MTIKISEDSFDKISYYLRPKKQIERKIFIEILRTMQLKFDEFDFGNYNYVGMGSVYYYDYLLFHKYLNIRNMVSFDSADNPERFIYNKPYDFINFENLTSTEFLRSYTSSLNSLIWIDYDSKIIDKDEHTLYETLVDDLALICQKTIKNDFFILSINCKLTTDKDIRKNIRKNLAKYISPEITHDFFTEKNFRFVVEDIVVNLIEEFTKHKSVKFQKLFSFFYEDGAPMYTIGGVFSNETKLKEIIDLEFPLLKTQIVDIDVPHLTYKEKILLDSLISNTVVNNKIDFNIIEEKLEQNGLKSSSIKKFKNYFDFYKYYPQYYEGIV